MLKLGRINHKSRQWPEILSIAILLFFILLFIFWNLASITNGLSPAEVASRAASHNLNGLLSNCINAPYKLLQHGLLMIQDSRWFLRLGSAVIGAIIAAAFYKLLRSMFGRIIGLFGAIFLVSLPLYAIAARQGTPTILLFWPAVLMYAAYRFEKSDEGILYWLLLSITAGIAFYTPGLIWWLIGAALLTYRKMSARISTLGTPAIVTGVAVFCLLIIPIVASCSLHPNLIKPLLALPASWPSPVAVLKDIGFMAATLFAKSHYTDSLILGHFPLLNITLVALVVFGGYALYTAARSKAFALFLAVLLSVVIAGINADLHYLALGLPALLIVATAGLRYLYIEWRSIFPRNPVPKTFALILIGLVAFGQIYFSANYILQAWPHAKQTHQRYVLK